MMGQGLAGMGYRCLGKCNERLQRVGHVVGVQERDKGKDSCKGEFVHERKAEYCLDFTSVIVVMVCGCFF